MGTTCCHIDFLSSITTENWIDIFGVVVNALLAYWIVRTIQNKLTNKRVLKDHFINEIKEIRNDYKTCLNNLYTNNTHPHRVIPWFKLMNIKVDDIMEIIHLKYKVNKSKLKPYQIELQELITNNHDFMAHYNNEKVNFSEQSKAQIIKFQQTHNQIFNEIIMSINDSE